MRAGRAHHRLANVRSARRRISEDPTDRLTKSIAYNTNQRSLYMVDWFEFDSEPERAVANMVDDDDEVLCWARLQRDELPIVWSSDGRKYNADLIVAEHSGDRWVVEVKADGAMTSDEVVGKRQAAKRWVNHVNSDAGVAASGVKWHYLLVSETDIKQATRSWTALRQLGV